MVKDLPMPTCSVPEKIVIYEHHCDNKFGNIVFVRKGKAQNNFLKHCERFFNRYKHGKFRHRKYK